MKRVALLTTFFETQSGYSLIGVAETQVRLLLDNGNALGEDTRLKKAID